MDTKWCNINDLGTKWGDINDSDTKWGDINDLDTKWGDINDLDTKWGGINDSNTKWGGICMYMIWKLTIKAVYMILIQSEAKYVYIWFGYWLRRYIWFGYNARPLYNSDSKWIGIHDSENFR